MLSEALLWTTATRDSYTAKLFYSIESLLGTVTTQYLDSNSVVTVVNCQQQSDYTIIDQLCSHHGAGSCQQ